MNKLGDTIERLLLSPGRTQYNSRNTGRINNGLGSSVNNQSVCFNCSAMGHLKRRCNLASGQGKPNSTCQLCSQRGHIATECRLFLGNPIMDNIGNANSKKERRARSLGRTNVDNKRARSKPPERQEKVRNDISISNSEISDSQSKSGFMYLHVSFSTTQISALLDSGSTINLMSRDLFDRLPLNNKVHVDHCHESIVLANNQQISIDYIAQVKGVIGSRQQSFNVNVLKDTAHQMILGTEYMRNNGVMLNFDNMSLNATSATVRYRKRILLEPNSETTIWGKTPKFLSPGLEGVCSGSAYASKKCLFVARSWSVVSSDQMVPFKVSNPTTKPKLQLTTFFHAPPIKS